MTNHSILSRLNGSRSTSIVDEHFAKAKVISGEAKKNDVVELIAH
jgi:hypothetical protein